MTAFEKNDDGKIRWDLLPWNEVEEVAKVLEFGAKKYDPENWKLVDDPQRYFAAAMRHLVAWKKGKLKDDETGLPHLSHACCCLLFLMWHDHNQPKP